MSTVVTGEYSQSLLLREVQRLNWCNLSMKIDKSNQNADMCLVMSKPVFGVLDQVRHEPAVQPQKIA